MPRRQKRIIPVPFWKWLLAYVTLGIGLVGWMVAFTVLHDIREFVLNVAMAMVFLIPSGWWFFCTAADERNARKYEEMRRASEATANLLGPEDQYFVDSLRHSPDFRPINRRWVLIVVLCFICFGVFGMMSDALRDVDMPA